jgi:hypothetical protein
MTRFILTTATFNFFTLKQKPRSPHTVLRWNGNDSRNKHYFPFRSHVTSAPSNRNYKEFAHVEPCMHGLSVRQEFQKVSFEVVMVVSKVTDLWNVTL